MKIKLLVAFACGISILLSLPTRAERTTRILDYSFKGPVEWRLGSGHTLRFEYVDRQSTSIRDQDATLLVLNYPEVVSSIIASENSKALLVLINEVQPSGGRNYARLLVIHERPDHTIDFQEKLPRDRNPMRKHRWVVELGAISDNADMALIKMGEPDRDEAPYSVGKVWETWSLKELRILKTGLRICD